MMVYIVHSLNYCCVEYYYACATHTLRMSYEFVTIVVCKNYITLQLCYNIIRYLFTRTILPEEISMDTINVVMVIVGKLSASIEIHYSKNVIKVL